MSSHGVDLKFHLAPALRNHCLEMQPADSSLSETGAALGFAFHYVMLIDFQALNSS